MPYQREQLRRLSACDCGETSLRDGIGLGTIYEVDRQDTITTTYVCGGCSKKNQLVAIRVRRPGSTHSGFIPQILFREAGAN